MHALSHRALVVAVVLVAATAATLAQGVGTVSGRVTDERGVPLDNVVVTLSSPGIIGVRQTATHEGGRYWFPGVPGSQPLTVKAEATGRVPVQYVGHTARRDGVVDIDFTLRSPGTYEILALVDEGVPYHRTALEGAMSTMPGHTSIFRVTDEAVETIHRLMQRLDEKPSAVLAVGDNASRLARRYIRDIPIVYSMVPAPLDADLTTANMCGVPLNGGFEAQMEHLRHVMPEARRIGTVYNPHRMIRSLHELKRAAKAAGMELIAADVHGDSEADLDAALDLLRDQRLDAFVLLLDPRLMDAERFEVVARFTSTQDLILAVPDPSLAIPEKSFAFVPGFWDLGAYAGLLVRRIVEGKSQPSQIGMTFPARDAMDWAETRLPRQTPRDVLPSEETRLDQIARDE